MPSRKPFYLMLWTDSCCRSECLGLKVLHKWQRVGENEWLSIERNGKSILRMLSLLQCFCLASSSHTCSHPLPASYFTSSFPCYPLVKEGKFTKIIFPLLVHYVTVLRVLSGLPQPRFGCHLQTQLFFQPFLLSQESILIPSNDRVWEKHIFPMETLRKQQKDENYSVWRISRHIFLKSRGQLDSNSR